MVRTTVVWCEPVVRSTNVPVDRLTDATSEYSEHLLSSIFFCFIKILLSLEVGTVVRQYQLRVSSNRRSKCTLLLRRHGNGDVKRQGAYEVGQGVFLIRFLIGKNVER